MTKELGVANKLQNEKLDRRGEFRGFAAGATDRTTERLTDLIHAEQQLAAAEERDAKPSGHRV